MRNIRREDLSELGLYEDPASMKLLSSTQHYIIEDLKEELIEANNKLRTEIKNKELERSIAKEDVIAYFYKRNRFNK